MEQLKASIFIWYKTVMLCRVMIKLTLKGRSMKIIIVYIGVRFMGLGSAHKGYEYQDLLTAYFIISQMLNNSKATFNIDKKENEDDKFDDLTIKTDDLIIKRQVKYSESKVLEKSDLSGNSYDIALDNLYQSWKNTSSKQNIEIRLCLAWDTPSDEDILQVLINCNIEDEYGSGKVKYYKVDINKIWEDGKQPEKSWRRLKDKSINIDRNDFSSFLDKLIIEVNLPKASLDVNNPGELEKLVISKLEDFGVGKYPNHIKSIPEVLVMLTHIVKNARARGKILATQEIIFQLGLQNNYGNIEQTFRIEESINVMKEQKYETFNEIVRINNKLILLGEPGAGKSWFIQNYINYLEDKSVKVIRHYCYTGINDTNERERITINIFIANLINDIIHSFPELEAVKPTKYGVDVEELQVLLNNIKEDTILIIDGIDHIGRIYNLHKESMRELDTKIIKTIFELQFSKKVKIILVTQPIDEINSLKETGYSIYDIPKWCDGEIIELINKHRIDNFKVSENKDVHEIIIDKSNGNPLYVTYLINEIKSIPYCNITLELLDCFPVYSNNLSSYYEYLMTKLEENDRVAMVFAGASFYLSENDLSEITGMGKYVSRNLKTLKSVLKFNSCTGGYAIYHESFRRFILEKLLENEVSVDVIYNDIIKWLEKKGFYNDKRAYNNFLLILFESNKLEHIENYINNDFVIQSLFYGNPLRAVKKNYEILLKTVCKLHSYRGLVICNEISSMLYSLEYNYDENLGAYYQGIGYIHSFEHLKDSLVYEGSPTLKYKEGLKVCYECSKNNIIPEWNPYIELFLKYTDTDTKKELEFFKYYVCANIDNGTNIYDLIEKVINKKYWQYRKIIINEFDRRDGIDNLLENIKHLPNKVWWEKSINEYHGKREYDLEEFLKILNNIKKMTLVYENSLDDLKLFIEQIGYFIENEKEIIDKFVDEINDINWFYNWIIFVIKTKEIISSSNIYCGDELEKKIINSYTWLVKDLDCFKGEPRACDIYNGRNIIYDTIIETLNYINSKDGWEEVLRILHEVSKNTTVSLQGAIMGPLSTDKLIDLFLEITNESNCEVIEKWFKNTIVNEEKHRLYSYLAEYSMKLAIFYRKAGKVEDACKEFKKGIQYLVSYSVRKDRTFSRLLNCIGSIYRIDNEIGINYIKKLKQVADSVVYHTDKSGTQSYPHEWFIELLNINLQVSLLFMRKELIEYNSYWILEENLEYMLAQHENCISSKIENILYRTLPTKLDDRFIKSYINNIEILIGKNDYELARIATVELINRFSNANEPYIENIFIIKRIKGLCSKLGVDYNSNIYNFAKNIKKLKSWNEENWINRYNSKIIERKSLDLLKEEELILYVKKKGIRQTDANGLIYYFENYQNLNDSSKIFFRTLIEEYSDNLYKESGQDVLDSIFESITTSKEIKAYVYMYMYLTFKGNWGERFTRIELFKMSFQYDSIIAEETFFNYVNYEFCDIKYAPAISDKIINSLVSIGYDDNEILKCWEALFEIIDCRLSGQYEYDWDMVLINEYQMSDEEILICVLLSRLKRGEASIQKWVYSGIEILLRNDEFKLKFIKPLKWFLDRKEKLVDTSVLIMLNIIRRNFTKKEVTEYEIDKKLLSLYPTTNVLLNNEIEKIIGKKKKRMYIPYKNKSYDTQIIAFCDYMGKLDSRIEYLYEYGINVFNIADKYWSITRNKSFIDRYRELIVNKKYSTFIPNIYFEDCLTKCMAEEIDMFLNENAGDENQELVEKELFDIAINNSELLINQQNSITVRPTGLLPVQIEEGIFEIKNDEWIEIAKYEEECLYENQYRNNINPQNMKKTKIFTGIMFNSNELELPYLNLSDEFSLYSNQFYYPIFSVQIKRIKEIIVSNICMVDDVELSFNKKLYLWLRYEILSILQIRIHNSENGIVGLDENDEEVLKFSWWQTFYYDNEHSNELIPFLVGSKLIMKMEKYEELCKLIGHKPKMFIYKI